MIQIEIIILTLIIAGILLILGFYFKKRALFLSLSGSIILIILGIILLGDSIAFAMGTNTTIFPTNDNGTFIQTDTVYKEQHSNLNYVLGFVIMFIGVAGTIGSAILLYNRRYEEEEELIE